MQQILTDAQSPLLADVKTVTQTSDSKMVIPGAQGQEVVAAALDSKHTPREPLLVINAGDNKEDYAVLSDHSADWPADLPSKFQTFLQQAGLTREQLQRNNVPFAALNQLLNQGYSGYILRWLALDDTLVKAVMYPFLDERAIQAEVIPEEKNNRHNKKYCSSLTTYIQTRVWPKDTAIPFKAEAMLKRAYGISGFFDGVETVVTRVWSLLLASLLANDLYYYYTYPDERYGTTLSQIFFTQSDNEQLSLTASLTRPTVWPELLMAPVAWGLIKAIRMSCSTTALDENAVQAIHDQLQQYRSSFSDDVLLWLLPVNRMRDVLDQIQRALLWDNRLSAQQRDVLYASLQSLSRRANKVTQWYVLETLSVIADGIALADFKRLAQANVAPDILLSLLNNKTRALIELQYQARHYKHPTSRETSWYAHYLKPLTRYLLSHYLLWCLGQPESKALQSLFWSFKAVKAYIKIKLIYTLYLGIKQLIDRYLAQKHCEEQGKLWLYMNQVADYICSVCGDLPVYYRNIFTAKDCLADFLRFPKPLPQILTLLNRLQPADNITTLDLSHQQFLANELEQVLSILQTRFPQLQALYLNQLKGQIRAAGAHSVAHYIKQSHLQILDLTNQGIGDNGTGFIAQVLPYSTLQYLYLSNNQITNLSAIAQALPRSTLQVLDLSENRISDFSPLAQALPNSTLQILDLSENRISDLTPLAQALPNSILQILRLEFNQIADISSLAQALLHSSLQALDLSNNQIADISVLAQALPHSILIILDLSGNQIVNLSAIAQALSQSTLLDLNLNTNQISDISYLIQTLPQSKLQTFTLSDNQIVDISALAQALPRSVLQTLDLSNNQIVSISPLSQALPHSTLKFLYLSDNLITDTNILPHTLAQSNLQSLDLGYNQIINISTLVYALTNAKLRDLDLSSNPIVNIDDLAQALPQSYLQNLFLSDNQIVDISTLAQALPFSTLQSLDLSNNQVVNLSALTQVLSYSQLQKLSLSNNQIIELSDLAKALPRSKLHTLYLNTNQIVNLSALAQALPHSALQDLDLSMNQIVNISTLAQFLSRSKLKTLSLSSNQIVDIGALTQALPHSALNYLNLGSNPLGDASTRMFANILTKTFLNLKHPLWINTLDPNDKKILAQAQPNTNISSLNLSNTQTNTTGAKALCRVLPQTKIPIGNLILAANPGIDPNVVDITTCIISAASSRQPPLPLRFFYQLTQLSLYPLQQTYLYTRNWLANRPASSIATIEILQADEKTTSENKLAKTDHTLLWQLSNHTAETTNYSRAVLTYAATHSTASRSSSANTGNSLLLFLFASIMLYAIYRLLQTTIQSFSALLSGVDEKNISPLASNKLVISSNLNFITGWWQSKSTSIVLQGECFNKACKQLMRSLISVDHTLKKLDERYQQLSDEGQADVERIRFYWLEHAEIVENLQATGKVTRKEIREISTAIKELQTEAERLLENDVTPALVLKKQCWLK